MEGNGGCLHPLSANTSDRLEDIADETRNFDFIGLVGIQKKQGAGYNDLEQCHVGNRLLLSIGWNRGWGSNRSWGVALMMGKKYKNENLKRTWHLPGAHLARALAA